MAHRLLRNPKLATWGHTWRRASRRYDNAMLVTLITDPGRHAELRAATAALIENKNRLVPWLTYEGPDRGLLKYRRGGASSGIFGKEDIDHYLHPSFEDIEPVYRERIYKFDVYAEI